MRPFLIVAGTACALSGAWSDVRAQATPSQSAFYVIMLWPKSALQLP
ncbi:MAG TPA: hypothetical protein VKO87_12755 [Gemmatimonadaceae bacterium]|nr:hypothetical protein [Gemmatimonadaceae bacterium]